MPVESAAIFPLLRYRQNHSSALAAVGQSSRQRDHRRARREVLKCITKPVREAKARIARGQL